MIIAIVEILNRIRLLKSYAVCFKSIHFVDNDDGYGNANDEENHSCNNIDNKDDGEDDRGNDADDGDDNVNSGDHDGDFPMDFEEISAMYFHFPSSELMKNLH